VSIDDLVLQFLWYAEENSRDVIVANKRQI